MGRTSQKLKATLWKCWIVRKKHFILTFFVVLLPILLFALLGYARSKVSFISKQEVNTSTYNEIFYEGYIYENFKFDVGNTLLYYTPDSGFTRELMRSVQLKFEVPNDSIEGFTTEEELLMNCKKNNSKVIYGVVFKELQGDSVPPKLKYDIRNYEEHQDWETDQLFPIFLTQYIPGRGSEKYFHGFISLQMAIDSIFIKMRTQSDLPVTLAMQEFPYPPHIEDQGLSDMFMTMLPFVTLFSFILVCPATLRRIVEEKDSGIKELMKMMGLPTSIMWLTWFIDAIIVNTFSIIFIVICMKTDWGTDSTPIEHCDALIFGIFLLLYCSACIALCFVISTLLSSPNFTTIVGILFWNITYIIPYSLGEHMKVMSFNMKMLLCLFPNVAMYYGYEAISIFEIRGLGVQWNNFFTSAGGGVNDITVGHVFFMLIIDTFLFLLLTYYIDSVRPGKYGLGKPWSFPFKALKNSFSRNKRRNSNLVEPVSTVNNDYVKIEMCSSVPGIQIENLFKHYQGNVAVNDLTINFYKGEITVLLGHNGAGKTTTMSIISGMVKATKGNVFIDDFNINSNIEYVRSMIGICPQHNLVFPNLSVKEHFIFFAMLNNIQDSKAKIDCLLHKLDIYKHRNKIPNSLSGGMKRKLCLGMALILEPKVLILDEPTSGLDPKSRREIWDILLNWRKNENLGNCTVLISTHFMEEAEVLGDRIAIMDHGNLIAYGTSMFLKNEYNTGYILTVIKNKMSTVDDSMIDDTVLESVPEAVPKIKMQTTMTYSLPNDKEKILKVIKCLEYKKNDLQIDNIGISITTLEDVFLRISKLVSVPDDESDTKLSIIYSPRAHKCYQSWILIKNHFMAFRKLWKTYSIYLLLCLVIILLTLLMGAPRLHSFISHKSELELNLGVYGPSYVFCSSTGDQGKTLLNNYKNVVSSQKGIVTVTPSVSDGLIKLGIDNIEKYKQHAIVAAEFNQSNNELVANIMYSNGALHGAPIALNLMMNAIAKTYIGPQSEIVTSNIPLPSDITEFSQQQSEIQIGLLWMLLVPMGMTFVIGMFLIHPFRERNSNLKHLLYMTGAKNISYWMQMFVFDFLVYFMICIIILILIVLSWNPIFHSITALGAIFSILLVYGIVALPYVYLFSYKKSISSAISMLQILNLFTGVVLTVIVLVLQFSGDEKYERIGNQLHIACNVSPQYWLTYNLIQYAKKAVWNYNWDMGDQTRKLGKCRYDQNPCCYDETSKECWDYRSYFVKGLTAGNICIFLLTFFIYFGLLILIDSVWLDKIKESMRDGFNSLIRRNEGQFVRLGSDTSDHQPRDDLFVAKGVSKKYGGRFVVNNVSFNVKKGGCFGLLGVNGAGKTTTFEMLTGSKVPNYGTAEIKDQPISYDLIENRNSYLSRIGYCPQFNAMNSILTGRELLNLFAELRGISENVEQEVQDWICVLGLNEYADVACGKYSGGNKRKLSLGMSLIGNLNVIMLDEPTSGVDPVSRRNLWNVLRSVKANLKQSIILTSHSMDECEALCDELAIIKAGQIKCSDNIPNLKLNYGKGFTVLMKVKREDDLKTVDCVDSGELLPNRSEVDSVEQSFKEYFKNLDPTLKDKHLSLLHFYLPNVIQLSELFEKMENFKTKYEEVEDYTINMATLEDVFLSVSGDNDMAAISKKAN